jgi:hypothetical protein
VAPLDLASMPGPSAGAGSAAGRMEHAFVDAVLLFAGCVLFVTLSIVRVRSYPLN